MLVLSGKYFGGNKVKASKCEVLQDLEAISHSLFYLTKSECAALCNCIYPQVCIYLCKMCVLTYRNST